MAEGDGLIYNNFKERVMGGQFNMHTGGDTIKVGLLTGYTTDIDNDDDWADVSASEESGTGYTAGGATLTNQVVSEDDGSDLGKFDATDLTWSGLDVGTPSHAVMYDDTHSSDLLIAAWELTTASNGGDYTLQWNASGIITLT